MTRAVPALTELKVTELRVLFSWADWCREGGSGRVLQYAAEHTLFPLVERASLARTTPDAYLSHNVTPFVRS